jgi:NAD(P)H-hydrate epimerase
MGAISERAVERLRGELGEYKALLVGSGLGKDKETVAFMKSLLSEAENSPERHIGFTSFARKADDKHESGGPLPPLVLDGDALNIISEWDDWASLVPDGSVLTPHPGEMARLLKSSIEDVQANRAGIAKKAAADWKTVVVLKGAGTVIATPKGKVYVSPFSNPALATAGSGDVLAGAIAGFVAQGLTPADAACAGVFLHGLAGDLLSDEFGPAGGLAGDLPVLLARAQGRVRAGGER